AAVPFAGWVASGAKIGRNAAKLGKLASAAQKVSGKAGSLVQTAKEVASGLVAIGPGALGKVVTGARRLGSNLNQLDVLQKMQKGMQRFQMGHPRMAMAMSMAGQTAANYGMIEVQGMAMNKAVEQGWVSQEGLTALGMLSSVAGRRFGGNRNSSLGVTAGGGSGNRRGSSDGGPGRQ
ncbi:hypothetical protein, partial [Paenibacillus sp. 7541]|uniref:hypothetical protein n=3 Tax=Paenibacillus TaxID=44249 RepID=UPI000BDB2469